MKTTKIIESIENGQEEKNEKTGIHLKFKYSYKKLLSYFIIYSILGFVTETVFGLLTKGVIESRKSMLYGPFCCIYGLGAICLIYPPEKKEPKGWYLFFYGIIIGSLIEYIVSFIGEYIFHIKWWDYSNYPFNINGRICLLFSVFWGLLTVVLNKLIHPSVDKFIYKLENKIPEKIFNRILTILLIFIAIDLILSCFALKMFFTRVIYENKIDNVDGVEAYYKEYLNIYQNSKVIKKIVNTLFSDKKMIRTFPNIKLTLKDGTIIWIKDILKDIKPYYIKIFEPKDIITLN